MDKFTNGAEYNNQFTQEELNNEIWKDVIGYEGLYKVSSLGRVKSLDKIVTHKDGRKQLYKGKLLSPYKSADGYLQVCLCKDNKVKKMYVHRVVSQSFSPNPDNLPHVNHKDEVVTNNRVSNLKWCTSKYNCNYGTRNSKIAKSRLKPVVMYDKQGNKLKEFKSLLDAERYLNKPKGNSQISRCCKGKRKSAYGYIWKYK